MAAGELSYDWHDAWGNLQHQVETFTVAVALARIEAPPSMAEMGDGGAFATPAPEFQEVELQMQGAGYRVPMPQRGNPNIAKLDAHLQLFADRTSYQAMHIEARFADGSVRSLGADHALLHLAAQARLPRRDQDRRLLPDRLLAGC